MTMRSTLLSAANFCMSSCKLQVLVPPGCAGLDMRAVELSHIAAIKNRLHGLDACKEILHRVELLGRKNTGMLCSLIAVIGKYVPARADNIRQGSQAVRYL